jgi:hypothetical protein
VGELISKSVGTSPSHVGCLGKPFAHCNKGPMSGEILGTVGRDPTVSKSNRLHHVYIFRFSFINSRYI